MLYNNLKSCKFNSVVRNNTETLKLPIKKTAKLCHSHILVTIMYFQLCISHDPPPIQWYFILEDWCVTQCLAYFLSCKVNLNQLSDTIRSGYTAKLPQGFFNFNSQVKHYCGSTFLLVQFTATDLLTRQVITFTEDTAELIPHTAMSTELIVLLKHMLTFL